MKNIYLLMLLIIGGINIQKGSAQGPPITADKPVMLGEGTKLVKSLTEIRNTERGTVTSIPLMVHYLPSSNSLIGVHIPYVNYSFDQLNESGSTIGDISILGKYQFYRKDQMGKTFRIVAKTLQTIGTGDPLGIDGMSLGTYQSYQGFVAGYESLKYGISNELGYNLVPDGTRDEIRYKLGFGLPLMKPSYPVNKVNLYFEYQSMWFVEDEEYMLLYAQGVQYAKNRVTVEAAIQFPLIQELKVSPELNFSLYLGARIII